MSNISHCISRARYNMVSLGFSGDLKDHGAEYTYAATELSRVVGVDNYGLLCVLAHNGNPDVVAHLNALSSDNWYCYYKMLAARLA